MRERRYPTGRGTTTAVGDQTFSAGIPDNANLVLLGRASAPLLPNEGVAIADKFGVMRYGRFSFTAAVEALQ